MLGRLVLEQDLFPLIVLLTAAVISGALRIVSHRRRYGESAIAGSP
jgi:hypothetical protein